METKYEPSSLLKSPSQQSSFLPVLNELLQDPPHDVLAAPEKGEQAVFVIEPIQEHLRDRVLLPLNKPEFFYEF